MFQNISDFKAFKEQCQNEKVRYHTYAISSEKVLTVVLKGLIKIPDKTILHSLKTQGLTPINCTEIPTHTRYPIYRITFAPGTTLAKVNHVRYIENIKIYWEKYESKKPIIQCYRCQAHGHTSNNCNKKAKCVKCAGTHDTRTCTKTADTSATCTNCGGAHPANYSKCSALIAFLAKKNTRRAVQNQAAPQAYTPTAQAFPGLTKMSLFLHPLHHTSPILPMPR